MTRQEYMQAPNGLHEDYYLQFATQTIKARTKAMIKLILNSKDKNFNDIDLRYWDDISKAAFDELARVNFNINGSRSASLSDGVCAAKAYAHKLKKENISEDRD